MAGEGGGVIPEGFLQCLSLWLMCCQWCPEWRRHWPSRWQYHSGWPLHSGSSVAGGSYTERDDGYWVVLLVIFTWMQSVISALPLYSSKECKRGTQLILQKMSCAGLRRDWKQPSGLPEDKVILMIVIKIISAWAWTICLWCAQLPGRRSLILVVKKRHCVGASNFTVIHIKD